MSTTEVRDDGAGRVDMSFEAIVIPVSDVDRAKEFYSRLGWRLDADFPFDNGFRVVQLTPPGSGCSVQFGTKITSAAPGSAQGLYLIVSDIDAARQDLVAQRNWFRCFAGKACAVSLRKPELGAHAFLRK
jgi:catechol 2,3-dioxygenase-like lactoylglutathione lyase family enzyme